MPSLNRFRIKLFSLLPLLITIHFPLSAQYFLLPDDIVQSYFPISEQYTIPEDNRVSQVLDRAKRFEEEGNHRQASRYYEFAYIRAQDSKAAPYILFKQSYLLENLDESIKVLKEIRGRYPDFPYNDAVLWELARRYYFKSDYDGCITTLKEILDDESGGAEIFTPYVFSFMGIAQQAMSRYDDAIEAHLMAIDRLALHADEAKRHYIVSNYLEVSRSYMKKGEYDRASDLLRRIIGSWEEPMIKQEAYILLAQTFEQSGMVENAYQAYSQLLDLYPESIYRDKAKQRLGEIKSDEKSPGEEVRLDIYDRRIPEGSYSFGEAIEITAEGGFFVQIGSFSIEKNASNLVTVLNEQGFLSLVEEAVLGQNRTFRVWVGPLATLEKAKETLKELEDLGYKGFIVRER
jgi:tetratricopeptide (TPR) repeat protein